MLDQFLSSSFNPHGAVIKFHWTPCSAVSELQYWFASHAFNTKSLSSLWLLTIIFGVEMNACCRVPIQRCLVSRFWAALVAMNHWFPDASMTRCPHEYNPTSVKLIPWSSGWFGKQSLILTLKYRWFWLVLPEARIKSWRQRIFWFSHTSSKFILKRLSAMYQILAPTNHIRLAHSLRLCYDNPALVSHQELFWFWNPHFRKIPITIQ